jgi:hypothetical protein
MRKNLDLETKKKPGPTAGIEWMRKIDQNPAAPKPGPPVQGITLNSPNAS